MGGPTETPAHTAIPPEFMPFAQGLMDAVSKMFPSDVAAQGTGRAGLAETAGGSFLPGGGRENPFISSLMGGVEQQGDIARRQLGAAAQRSGALNSTDYLTQANQLEQGLAQKRGSVLADVFNQERGRQSGAQSQLANENPFANMFNFLGMARGTPGETKVSPNPFMSFLSGVMPLFKWS